MLKMVEYLVKMEIEFGNVEIVDILLLEKVLQKFVLFVAIQKLILKSKQKIISRKQNFLLSFFVKDWKINLKCDKIQKV